MPTKYIADWIDRVDHAVDYWSSNSNNLNTWQNFIADNKTYSNLITSCVSKHGPNKKTPVEFQIDINSFPEPYYGNPDDSVCKSAVVLFYNPGASNLDLIRGAHGPDTFQTKYSHYRNSYRNLSEQQNFIGFKGNTLEKFIKPKEKSLHKILNDCSILNITEEPFFLDLVPWHSPKFGLFDVTKFQGLNELNQAKLNVFIPATLIAYNSLLTDQAKRLAKRNDIVVFMAVGAKYSKDDILKSIGFSDETEKIQLMNNPISPQITPRFNRLIPHTILTTDGDITYSAKSYLRLWKISGKKLIEGLEYDDDSGSILSLNSQHDVYVFVINVWNRAQGMTLPDNLGPTINEILKQLTHL